MDKDQLFTRLKAHHSDLENLGIASVSVFGSVARGESGPQSDVDLLVTFSRPVGLLEFVNIKDSLEELLGCRVDLVTPDALKPQLRDRILREAIRAA